MLVFFVRHALATVGVAHGEQHGNFTAVFANEDISADKRVEFDKAIFVIAGECQQLAFFAEIMMKRSAEGVVQPIRGVGKHISTVGINPQRTARNLPVASVAPHNLFGETGQLVSARQATEAKNAFFIVAAPRAILRAAPAKQINGGQANYRQVLNADHALLLISQKHNPLVYKLITSMQR